MSANDKVLREKLLKLTKLNYEGQAKWFLNGFWNEGLKEEAENVWNFVDKFVSLDIKNKKNGSDLDEFCAHQFLESFGETLTVVDMRKRLKEIDLDFNGRVALIEYLIFRYKKGLVEVVDAPQGDNTEQVNEAAAMLRAVQAALSDLLVQLQEQEEALRRQKAAVAAAKEALAAQKAAEDQVRAAEAELKAAVEDLYAQETAYQTLISTLETKGNDETISVVQRNKARNELAQAKSEDPLPLRKAKITQEAALRRVEKERKAAEAATAAAAAKAAEAEKQRLALEAQKLKVEEAVELTQQKVAEAEAFLEQVKRKGGVAHGDIWWMEREIYEAKKYLPLSKGGIARR